MISQGPFYIIPVHIAEDHRLDDSCKLLYGRILSLSNAKQYCFASDAYLAEKSGCSEREIKYRLKNLEDLGYIRRETKRDGLRWDRKIIPNINYEGNKCSPAREQAFPFEGNRCAQYIDKSYIDKSLSSESTLSDLEEDTIYFLKPGGSKPEHVHSITVRAVTALLQSFDSDIIAETILRLRRSKEVQYPEQYAIGIAEKVREEKKQKKEDRHDYKPKRKSVRGGNSQGGIHNTQRTDQRVQYVRRPMEWWNGDKTVPAVPVDFH